MLNTKTAPLITINGFRPIQSASSPAKCREDTSQKYRRNDDRQLTSRQLRRCLKIGQRADDDADIDAIEETAEASDEQQEAVVDALAA